MKILLLIPPTDIERSYGKLKKFSNPQPSIGVAYIAAVLRKNGHDVQVMDAYVKGDSLSDIVNKIRQYAPDVIGLSVLTPSAEVVYEISKNIRTVFPNIKIVMGNIHASLFSNEILTKGYADFIIHREGELTMSELFRALESGGRLESVKGISFKKDGAIIDNPINPPIEDLDSLPFPAWDLFPMDKYSTDPRTEVRKGIVERQILATRGCPNQCTFCSSRTEKSLGSKYRMRNPKCVVDEMVYMNERFGDDVFGFTDLAFPLVRDHAIGFCNEIIKRGYAKKFKWFTECRVKPLDIELLTLMKKAGCVRVCFGIESGNDKILKVLKKNFTVDDVRNSVLMTRKAGIVVDGMLMIGLPDEVEEDINQTIDFAVKLKLRYAIFNIFVPYPGCELYDTLKSENKINYKNWSDFTSYPSYSGGMPVYVPDGLSKEKLMELQKKAMKKFYLRPGFILNEITNFKFNKIGHYIEGLK
ncbi:MAG: cobalamin B12-binding domain-containing protein, partial [Candidatus Omnitrophica bacterium]|nr:cobalamin B12-binding domain-containing protein [Candidatus Omnitrophota bacterium]